MKNLLKNVVILLSLTSAVLLLGSCSSDEETTVPESTTTEKAGMETEDLTFCCNSDSLPFETLSQAEIDALLLMREEELLARDVYSALYVVYHVPVFNNISKSEQQHSNAILRLLTKYNLEDPALNHQPGVFVNQDLQMLYTSLVAQGEVSRIEAYRVGATIEDLDIKDLMDLMETADNQDIRLVFANLTKGSRNHIRSFSRLMLLSGVTYVPQFISPELYAWIISTPHERGCING
ncbi:MAG: DUF2202 domain-containing protein [Bacteroidales bacterium]|nr:DUF2202 domain-containing protein [Bacteroidales bacterium]MBK9357195.1 DUF2202 domain-containing protein [Bacteroidales bacterium]